MSDHFITNITGVPTTGQYGPDGKPLNVNNDGGIEVTPQNVGNVPSAGTESREGIGNDKSIAGNPYNPNASSTDSQSIGPSSPPDQTHYANAQSHSLYKQASIGGDKTDWNLYKQDPVDVLSGDLSTYDGYYSILTSSDIGEGQSTFNPTPMSDPIGQQSFTVWLGSTSNTSVFTAGYPQGSITQNIGRENRNSKCFVGTSDVPCEIAECADGTPLGKKMRIFVGNGCQGLNGYWMQVTNPLNKHGFVYDPPRPPDYDPTDCDSFTLDGGRRKRFYRKPFEWSMKCWIDYVNATQNNPAGANPNSNHTAKPVWGHRLTYVGPTLEGISDKKWCEYCKEESPKERVYPNGDCYAVSGWKKWFLEGPSCNKNEQLIGTYDGKLYGCCCQHVQGADEGAANYNCPPLTQDLFTLDEDVINTVTVGSEDDPCDCRYRENQGAIFNTNYNKAASNDNQRAFVSGCTEASAQVQATGTEDNIYIMTTGTGEAPYFDSGECAWMYSFSGAERCAEVDSQSTATPGYESGYCPTGALVLISDRHMFEDSYRFTNFTGCVGKSCTECVIGDPLFEVGDSVTIATYQLSGYEHSSAKFHNGFEIDLSLEGVAGNTLGGPFHTGCGPPDYAGLGMCSWIFNQTGGGFGEDLGNWVLQAGSQCCACDATFPTKGIQPGGTTWIGTNGDEEHYSCYESQTGCNVLTQSWKIDGRASGNWDSTPDSLDCTWGYSIVFTGCPEIGAGPDGVQCSGTGYAPRAPDQYIPEHYFTSGSPC